MSGCKTENILLALEGTDLERPVTANIIDHIRTNRCRQCHEVLKGRVTTLLKSFNEILIQATDNKLKPEYIERKQQYLLALLNAAQLPEN